MGQTIRKIGASPFVLVVESLNQKTGMGSKFGSWLLERGLTPKYGYMGTNKEGEHPIPLYPLTQRKC